MAFASIIEVVFMCLYTAMNFFKNHLKVLCGLTVLGILGFATTVFAINWSNTQFIDSTFWAQNPTSGEIVAALFGNANIPTATAYTTPWSTNACIGANISVQYVGTDSLPQLLTSNTIYVLTGNQAITGEITFLGSCIGLVSSGGQYGLTKGTGVALGVNNSMIYATNANNIIIDGISLDAYETTASANMGLYANGSSVNHVIINNITSKNANYADLSFYLSSDVSVYNSKLGNLSTVGLVVDNGS